MTDLVGHLENGTGIWCHTEIPYRSEPSPRELRARHWDEFMVYNKTVDGAYFFIPNTDIHITTSKITFNGDKVKVVRYLVLVEAILLDDSYRVFSRKPNHTIIYPGDKFAITYVLGLP